MGVAKFHLYHLQCGALVDYNDLCQRSFDERACGSRFSLVPRIRFDSRVFEGTTATLLMFAYLVCCWLLLLLPSVAVGETAKPNVVILFADDVSSCKLNFHDVIM